VDSSHRARSSRSHVSSSSTTSSTCSMVQHAGLNDLVNLNIVVGVAQEAAYAYYGVSEMHITCIVTS
jgi:hypothetical protein